MALRPPRIMQDAAASQPTDSANCPSPARAPHPDEMKTIYSTEPHSRISLIQRLATVSVSSDMWRCLRKSLFLLLTAMLGIVAGVLIRFAFGQSLQWEKPAAESAKQAARTGEKPGTIEKSAPPPVNLTISPAVEELRVIAAGDTAALERMLDKAWNGQMDGRNPGPEFNRQLEQLVSLDPMRAMAWAKQHLFGSGKRFVFDMWLARDRAAAEAWAAANNPALLKAAKQSPPPLSDDELVKLLASDPAALDARMASDPNLISRIAKLRVAQIRPLRWIGQSPQSRRPGAATAFAVSSANG